MIRLALVLLLLTCALAPATAQDRAAAERQFRTWLGDTVWPRARAEGIRRATFDAATAKITLDWTLPGLDLPGAGPRRTQQSEFGSPAGYFRASAVDPIARIGRDMAARHRQTLAAVEKRTGVPGRVVLAIWGRESAFGRVGTPHDAFRVLATRAFFGPDADYFTGELIAAMKIAQSGRAATTALTSSWAGAMGQPQFMPSSYLAYATDGDGDRHSDIWRSEEDTIASIAAFLAANGWVAGRDWGFEVTLPRGVSCALEGPDQGRPIADWAAMGITRVSGRPFPAAEARAEGFLLLPAGRHGPAFIVTPNFYVLKRYNRSDLYALFIGNVGDRIQYNMGGFIAPWGRVGGLYRSDVAAMQRALEGLGHDTGGSDGLAGYKTRRAIGRWQEASGRPSTCYPEAAMKSALER